MVNIENLSAHSLEDAHRAMCVFIGLSVRVYLRASVQSFKDAHKGMICVDTFIEISVRAL